MSESSRLTLTVRINGTGTNPFAGWGLRCNPFPQLGRAEFDAAERQINSLGGEPVEDADDIRHRLAGFSEEFIEGCVARWRPGLITEFEISFPDPRSAEFA